MNLVKLQPIEKTRIYHFPNGERVELSQVTHFCASTTTHRLKTKDGKLHIVPLGWIHIEIDASAFTL